MENINQSISNIILDYIEVNLEMVSKNFASFFKSEFGLSHHQMSVVWYLRKEGQMTMSQMSEKLQISKQQATKLIELLVSKHYVVRVYCKENRRIINIALGDEGREVISIVEKKYVEYFLQNCEGISLEEKKELIASMDFINKIVPKLNFHVKK